MRPEGDGYDPAPSELPGKIAFEPLGKYTTFKALYWCLEVFLRAPGMGPYLVESDLNYVPLLEGVIMAL